MAKDNNDFSTSVESLLRGMDGVLSSKTVVGEAIHVNDSVILPLVDVQFGMGAGAFTNEKKNNSAGGMGAKMTPSAVLVIQNGAVRLINVKNQDTVARLLDMVPDVVNKFTAPKYKEDKDVDEAVDQILEEEMKENERK